MISKEAEDLDGDVQAGYTVDRLDLIFYWRRAVVELRLRRQRPNRASVRMI
jgi:hypothetical protein